MCELFILPAFYRYFHKSPLYFKEKPHTLPGWLFSIHIIMRIRFLSLLACFLLIWGSHVSTISAASEFFESAEKLSEKNIISRASSAYAYRLDDPITRGEMSKILFGFINTFRSEGISFGDCSESSFLDVDEDSVFCRYVVALVDDGIISKNSRFYPERPLTRAEMTTLLLRWMQEQASESPETVFSDISEDIVGIHSGYITRARELGIVQSWRYFRPLDPVTRGEAFTMIARLLPDSSDS